MADDPFEHVTEAQITAGRKVQLQQYEPIDERASLTVEFPEGATPEEKRALLDAVEEAAWEQCEQGVMRRFEEHLRSDDE